MLLTNSAEQTTCGLGWSKKRMRPGKQPWSSTMARRFRGSAARSRSWFTTVSASISALMVPLVLTSRTSNQPLHSIEIKDFIFNETINFGQQNVRKWVKTSVTIFHILCDIVKLLLFFLTTSTMPKAIQFTKK